MKSKKAIKTIILILKILTWTCLVIACYLVINAFLQNNEVENHTYKYRALIFAAVGYFSNYLVKRIPKELYKEDLIDKKE